jgi:hypothetical protein
MQKEIRVKKMFLLWEIMAELESLLWEVYFEDFMDICIERESDVMNDSDENDIPF